MVGVSRKTLRAWESADDDVSCAAHAREAPCGCTPVHGRASTPIVPEALLPEDGHGTSYERGSPPGRRRPSWRLRAPTGPGTPLRGDSGSAASRASVAGRAAGKPHACTSGLAGAPPKPRACARFAAEARLPIGCRRWQPWAPQDGLPRPEKPCAATLLGRRHPSATDPRPIRIPLGLPITKTASQGAVFALVAAFPC